MEDARTQLIRCVRFKCVCIMCRDRVGTSESESVGEVADLQRCRGARVCTYTGPTSTHTGAPRHDPTHSIHSIHPSASSLLSLIRNPFSCSYLISLVLVLAPANRVTTGDPHT